jgi:hypothetical protein
VTSEIYAPHRGTTHVQRRDRPTHGGAVKRSSDGPPTRLLVVLLVTPGVGGWSIDAILHRHTASRRKQKWLGSLSLVRVRMGEHSTETESDTKERVEREKQRQGCGEGERGGEAREDDRDEQATQRASKLIQKSKKWLYLARIYTRTVSSRRGGKATRFDSDQTITRALPRASASLRPPPHSPLYTFPPRIPLTLLLCTYTHTPINQHLCQLPARQKQLTSL